MNLLQSYRGHYLQHPGTEEVLRRAAEPSHELLRSPHGRRRPLSAAARLGLNPGPAAGEAYGNHANFLEKYGGKFKFTYFQSGQQQQQQPPVPKDQLHFRSLTRAGHLPPPPPVPRDILAVYAKRDPNSERKMAGNSNPQRLPSSPLIVNMPADLRNRSSAAAMTEVPRV